MAVTLWKLWLMKPYPETSSTTSQKKFNYRQSKQGWWWRMLLEGSKEGGGVCRFQADECANIVGACVVMHNICEQYGDV